MELEADRLFSVALVVGEGGDSGDHACVHGGGDGCAFSSAYRTDDGEHGVVSGDGDVEPAVDFWRDELWRLAEHVGHGGGGDMEVLYARMDLAANFLQILADLFAALADFGNDVLHVAVGEALGNIFGCRLVLRFHDFVLGENCVESWMSRKREMFARERHPRCGRAAKVATFDDWPRGSDFFIGSLTRARWFNSRLKVFADRSVRATRDAQTLGLSTARIITSRMIRASLEMTELGRASGA